MAFRNSLFKNFKNYLLDNTSAVSYSTGYIDDVNDFPSIAIIQSFETRIHMGDANKVNYFTFMIRGYIHSTTDKSVKDSEQLAYEIEVAMKAYTYPNLYNLRIVSIDIDPGLIDPYGLCDIKVRADYIGIC